MQAVAGESAEADPIKKRTRKVGRSANGGASGKATRRRGKVGGSAKDGATLEIGERKADNKAIIFSQYSSMIDMVEWKLKVAGVGTVKLMGYMPMKERRAVLDAFKTKASVKVIIMSLKAGGEGLNLQEASHVFVQVFVVPRSAH